MACSAIRWDNLTRTLEVGEAQCGGDAAVGVAVCLAAILFCAPFLAYVPWIGDEGILLRGATEMLRGRVLYADFFELHPPGGFLLTEAWLRMAGVCRSHPFACSPS